MKHYNESAFMHAYPLSQKKPFIETLKKFPLLAIVGFFSGMAYSVGLLEGIYSFLLQRIPYLERSFFFLSQRTPYFFNIPMLIITVIFSVSIAFAIIYWYETLYFKTYFYNITDKFLVIRKGVITSREITVPFERIQDIYLDQDVVDRMFDLYDVHISTATIQSTARAHIDGVERHTAEQLREVILQKMQEAKR